MGNPSSVGASHRACATRLSESPRSTGRARAVSPFAHLQLFRNPFGELTREERRQLARVDVQPYVDWLSRKRAALQFVGPCGHGKTTHLLALERELPDSAYVYFPEEGTQPCLPVTRPLLIDEGQRLGWRRRRQLLRSDGPLVIGTHVDMGERLSRAGFEVWTINLAAPLATAHLQAVLNARITASAVQSRLSDGSSIGSLTLSIDQVVALQQRFGSNIRHIEHHLYEVFQRFAEKGEP